MHAHTVALEPLDLGRGDIDELVGKIGERAGRCDRRFFGDAQKTDLEARFHEVPSKI